MKLFILMFAIITAQATFGAGFEGQEISIEDFISMEEELNYSTEDQAYPVWNTSATSCYAYTFCPNGRRIFCQTYGYNYSRVPNRFSNSCRWMVLPGRAVRCQGYSVQRDIYGRTFWSYIDIPVSCY